jgi:hypothetical protein
MASVRRPDGEQADIPVWYAAGPHAGEFVDGVQPVFPAVAQHV